MKKSHFRMIMGVVIILSIIVLFLGLQLQVQLSSKECATMDESKLKDLKKARQATSGIIVIGTVLSVMSSLLMTVHWNDTEVDMSQFSGMNLLITLGTVLSLGFVLLVLGSMILGLPKKISSDCQKEVKNSWYIIGLGIFLMIVSGGGLYLRTEHGKSTRERVVGNYDRLRTRMGRGNDQGNAVMMTSNGFSPDNMSGDDDNKLVETYEQLLNASNEGSPS